MILLITSSLFMAGAYGITYLNSPRYANIMLGIVALSFLIAQIEAIQMVSLLGIVGVLVVMVKSRSEREKSIQCWFAEQGFKPVQATQGPVLFKDQPVLGTVQYTAYQNEMAGISFQLVVRYHSYRTGNSPSIVLHSCFYFGDPGKAESLAQTFADLRDKTPHSNFLTSQFRYFDLKAADILKPETGGVAVCWRVPDTVRGYTDRYEWVRKAVSNCSF